MLILKYLKVPDINQAWFLADLVSAVTIHATTIFLPLHLLIHQNLRISH